MSQTLRGQTVQLKGAPTEVYEYPQVIMGVTGAGALVPLQVAADGTIATSASGSTGAAAQSAFTLDGTSQTLATTTSATKMLRVTNPTANGSVYIRLDGGAASSSDGASIEIQGGGSEVFNAASFLPVGVIKILGTNTQKVVLITA